MIGRMDNGAQSGFDWAEEINGEVQNCVRKKRKYNKSKKKEYKYNGWGSTSLIQFLKSIGRDTSSKISQSDVTKIINDYVKQNNLLKPTNKKRILCDVRLQLLFGRKSINRIKISNFLESHYLENCGQSDEDILFDSDVDEYACEIPKPAPSERKSQPRKHVVEKPRSCFAAINSSNIKLVYLKRSLVEELLKDLETFETKVVRSFIRIKCDPNDYLQKNSHLLLQVKGIKKGSGVDGEIRLQASGFIKDITINMLSDDNFSEEECDDLHRRIKDGLLKKPTIVDLEEKARVLHEDITKHWLARELALLQNLIDRANEKGWRRELDGYLQRREKLKRPEEHERLLHVIPEVIAEDLESESTTTDVPVKKLKTSFQEFSETTCTKASLASEVPEAVADDSADYFSDDEEWLFHGIPQVTTDFLDFSESQLPEVPDKKAEVPDKKAENNSMQSFWEATRTKESLVTEVSNPVANGFACKATKLSLTDQTDQENESPKSILNLSGPSEVPLFSMEINSTALNCISRDASAVNQWSSVSVQQQPAKETNFAYKMDGVSMTAKSNEFHIGNKISQAPTVNQVRPAQVQVIELSDDDDDEESEKPSTIKPLHETPSTINRVHENLNTVNRVRENLNTVRPVPAEELQALVWHYRDPQGQVQGPFSIVALKGWRDAHYFTPDFKVWRAGQSQDQSVLLKNILPKFFPFG
ncbi:uncharacterized protein At5g08430-like [Vicia villosa]|uniref:uncharacterized protein At5g08430-like n=1 Tax=Vicia villosa TaxID=3911 RepID=UPI00273CAC6F|nr:uncharacterized protein At5g08430-like [Vicia villosa]XP_058779338.1 uncharacterized protein At5g08430-like [Vicia villosa]